MGRHLKAALIAGLGAWGCLGRATASEHKFTYTYESEISGRGEQEVEPWVTWRAGRDTFYSRFDYRMEYERGLNDHLQTSLYLNWHQVSQENPSNPGQKISSDGFDGISSEWIYRCLDRDKSPVGLALYQEYTVQSDQLDWESKLIVDKKMGKNLLAYNAVIEPSWEFGPGNTNYDLNLENDLGFTHFFIPTVSAGFEIVNLNDKLRSSPGLQSSSIFIGPVIAYENANWWIAMTILRQLPAIKRSIDTPQDTLVLDRQEKMNIRVIGSIKIGS
jgi:hypothetical protein